MTPTVRVVLDRAGFVEAILVAPVGAVVLGVLEGEARDDVQGWEIPTDSRQGAVLAAADAVRTRSFGALVALAVDAACMRVGPWIPSASTVAAEAFRHAEARLPSP